MNTSRKPGFTLIEFLVVLAILSLLMALLYPVFAHAREKANQATCASNLRQIGLAAMQYGGDNDGLMFHTLPHVDASVITQWSFCWNLGHPPVQTVDTSCGPLAPFLRSAGVWNCPAASNVQAADYFNLSELKPLPKFIVGFCLPLVLWSASASTTEWPYLCQQPPTLATGTENGVQPTL